MIEQYKFNGPFATYFSTTDTSFVTGDSPVVIDVNTVLTRNATDGYIVNDGPGDLIVSLSQDGVTYGNDIRMKTADLIKLENLNVDSMTITWVSNSAYRIFAV